MRSEKRLPAAYLLTTGDAIINAFHSINLSTEKALKAGAFFSTYTGLQFRCHIWWDYEDQYWCAEIWQKGRYISSLASREIQMLADDIDRTYGP
jgi:hypothetical protein